MITVRINGEQAQIASGGVGRMGELVELIKSVIDPDHMITSLQLDGNELSDNDWNATTNSYESAVLEVETDTPAAFVNDRIGRSPMVVQECFLKFRDARKAFQDGEMLTGNQHLVHAVRTLQSFFQWYSSLLDLVPVADRSKYDITEPTEDLSEICKRICQQQLYQSWWALGETIEKELEPKLDKLEDLCRRSAKLAC
jgi:hypothetical protein